MLDHKYQQLQDLIKQFPRVLIAYSGGIDSTLVAKIAYDALDQNAIAVTANSPALFPNDLLDAQSQAKSIGIRHQLINTHELQDPRYHSNPPDRCYFCKSELYDTLRPLALSLDCAVILDGLNSDDLQDYRPGIKAAKERGIFSPLAAAAITKLEVRQLSQQLGLPWWNKPSQPCLSSRFPYGEAITAPKLTRVGQGEYILRQRLRQILGQDCQIDLRLRSIGDTARIEIPVQYFSVLIQEIDLTELTQALRQIGFTTIVLDLEGFRSGKLNDVLVNKPQNDGTLYPLDRV